MKSRAVSESVPAKTHTEQPLLDNNDCVSENKTKGTENTIQKPTASLAQSIYDFLLSLKGYKIFMQESYRKGLQIYCTSC